MVRVSVVVVTNRRSEFLGEALASVSSQTLKDWELILVDDGSEHADWIEGSVGGFSNSRVIHRTHSGSAVSRNVGAAEANAPFVVFLDDDDLMASARLELQVNALDNDQESLMCFSGGHTIDHEGSVLNTWPAPRASREEFVCGLVDIPRISTLMVRREAFLALGGFNPMLRFAEDDELILRLIMAGQFSRVDEALASYRRNPAGKTATAPYTRRVQSGTHLLTALRWGALERGDYVDAQLLEENMARFRKRVARVLASESLASLRRGTVMAGIGSMAAALRYAPISALAEVSRKTTTFLGSSRSRSKASASAVES